MHIHILGICGTFMGGVALLARELGHRVTGSDANVYPPMSTQLEEQGIELMEGYLPEHLEPAPDLVIIGNALSRGNPAVEHVLNRGLPYVSGPQWLGEQFLQGRWVLACAGTHGKTTTSSMLAWILEDLGYEPGFLIGGVPGNFGLSARAGGGRFFVMEADEYDTAFFDKRSKFVHYRPQTVVLNNLEFDHADIFPDLAAIQRQFHHLIRTVPGIGRIILPAGEPALEEVLDMGCWSEQTRVGLSDREADWQAEILAEDCSHLRIHHKGSRAELKWGLTGRHNLFNGLAAMAAANHVGVTLADAVDALSRFEGVKRRMELLGTPRDIAVYDDFAHHPTAIASTLDGLRRRVGSARIFAVIEPRSNTMRLGQHRAALAPSTNLADEVLWFSPPGLGWSLDDVVEQSEAPAAVYPEIDQIIAHLRTNAKAGDHIVIMSNGGFAGIHQKLLTALAE
ncbi:UDP-N-acetylmuramate: L-alanyl-gamma-D-glutamyl-meso-diaminopimelate ligase [Litorivivens lipolytica]|uniref:UDP-N-acetylmuramate--L-alanyl-gamma-D-glutamyl-meso-2,6-diaminoheptandioate ligase n=1 Tax=Litorivivens lipolytica TaxID=1524264 RepID=A0A7W4W5N9_9GAMM|nr:UDP-N-acetylmuramate:L-alanyl-gamma-D-glutamyl-meso-diaminopimelate ligase [Litorivivens lipolytica]MBB3047904.1 UDP-N-acetylmuramate: L-alanyl-gamma-D-glutamyl-meso-diaminopimelate ligase [Litorivivens lipolytica]